MGEREGACACRPVRFGVGRRHALLLWLLTSSPSFAECSAEETCVTEVTVEAARDEGGSAAVTVVRPDDLPDSADVATAVSRAPGANVRRLGGLGDFASVSIRGSTPRQVAVLLDGVPLNPDGAGAVDLSELPLAAFERVEVYRGNAPPELGTSAMGGVVNLVSGDAPTNAASATLGGLHTARVNASAGWDGGFAAVEGFTSDGAFRYLDDRGTVYTPDDDAPDALRRNNDKAWLSAHVRRRWGTDRLRVTVQSAGLAREEGVPGPVGYPTPNLRYAVLRDATVVQLDARGDAVSGVARAWGHVRRERLDDSRGELGAGPRVRVDDLAILGLHSHAAFVPDPRIGFGVVVDGRREVHVGRELRAHHADSTHVRHAAKVAASATLRTADDRVSLTPALQQTWVADARLLAATTPRIGLRIRPSDGVVLKANAGTYLRPPDLLELYGERGAFVGRADLRPERGRQADVGVRVGAGPWSLDVTGFATRATDLIVYVPNAQQVAFPVNLGETRVLGVEAAGALDVGPLSLSSNLTRSASANLSDAPAYAGKQLPRVPAWEWHHQTALELGRVRLLHALDFVGGDFRDATNWFRDPPRLLHTGSVRVALGGGVSASLDVLNAADHRTAPVRRNPLDPDDPARVLRPVTDFVGYPLPGRTAMLTLRWSDR